MKKNKCVPSIDFDNAFINMLDFIATLGVKSALRYITWSDFNKMRAKCYPEKQKYKHIC